MFYSSLKLFLGLTHLDHFLTLSAQLSTYECGLMPDIKRTWPLLLLQLLLWCSWHTWYLEELHLYRGLIEPSEKAQCQLGIKAAVEQIMFISDITPIVCLLSYESWMLMNKLEFTNGTKIINKALWTWHEVPVLLSGEQCSKTSIKPAFPMKLLYHVHFLLLAGVMIKLMIMKQEWWSMN